VHSAVSARGPAQVNARIVRRGPFIHPYGTAMTPAEVTAARERLDLTPERLAAELAVTEGEVRGWEDGSISIPRRYAQQLVWEAALKERDEALVTAGLPACEWVQAWEQESQPDGLEQQVERLESLEAHAKACPVCRVRERYAEEYLPPLPEAPMPTWVRVVGHFSETVERLPRWARPAAYGAVLIGALTLARALLAMLATGFSLELLGMAVVGIAVGAYLGVVGGLTYYAIQQPFRRFGRAAPYLTGIVVAAAYLLAFGIPELFLSEDPMLADPAGWVIAGVLVVVFGLAIGHWWFRETEPPRLTMA
jgi:hypothetical protein